MSEGQFPAARPLEPRHMAIVVGASSGIGAALVRKLSREGYLVAALARRMELLKELCDEINALDGTRALPYHHDVLKPAEVQSLLQKIIGDLGGLDLFVYNAGIQYLNDPSTYDLEQDLLTVQVNALGAIAWLNPVAQRFEKAGAGHIVAIGSVAGDRARRGNPAYAASKAALHAYVEGMRNRLAPHGVRVTTIKPGQVDTELLKNADRIRGPISPEWAGDLIWRAIRSGRQTAYVPPRWGLISLVVTHIPSFIFRRMSL